MTHDEQKMKSVDDTTLVAYVDGELDSESRTEVEARLAADPDLRADVASLRESSAMLGAAFNNAMHGPMPPIAAFESVKSFGDGNTQSGGRTVWPMALAASLGALMVGAIGGHYVSDLSRNREFKTVSQMQIEEEREMSQAFSRSLESELSGTPVSWKNPNSGSEGQFIPVRTFQSKTGQYCREFKGTKITAGANFEESGIACRDDNGQWKVRLRYYPE